MDNKKTIEFINLVEKFMNGIDYENEHGDYHAPDYYIPLAYEDEGDDYYKIHDEIIQENTKISLEIEKMIKEFKKGN